MIPDDKHFYPGSDVLINKFDIRDGKAATAAEYKFAAARELELREHPIQGKFDLVHLQAIHKHLFQDMYEWAGEPRSINFAKRNMQTGYVNRFAPAADIDTKSAELAKLIADNNQLKGLSKPDFIKTIAEVYTKLNEIHPFREGNGRSTRVFLTQLAQEAGYQFDISKIEKDRWNLASHKALVQHHPQEPDVKRLPSVMDMRQIFHEACNPITREQGRAAGEQVEKALPGREPPHAIAFDKLPPKEAFQRYPELAAAYRVLAQAQKFAQVKLNTPEDRKNFFNGVRERVSRQLHEGKQVDAPSPDQGYER